MREEVDYHVESNLEDDYLENEEIYADFDFTNSQEDSDVDSEDEDNMTEGNIF